MERTDLEPDPAELVNLLKADLQGMPLAVRQGIARRLAEAAQPQPGAAEVPKHVPAAGSWPTALKLATWLALPLSAVVGAAVQSRWAAGGPTASSAPRPPVSRLIEPAALSANVVEPRPLVPETHAKPAASGPPTTTLNLRPDLAGDSADGRRSSPQDATNSVVKKRGDLELLEQAQSKLSEGDALGALALAREHRRRYPRSAFEQERGAVEIRALFSAGRKSEAERQASEFLRRFADSPLRMGISGSAGKNP